jgi:hypothetical protein
MSPTPAHDPAESRDSYVRRVQRAACQLARTHGRFTADDIARLIPDAPPGVDKRIIGSALNGLRAEELIEPVAFLRLDAKRCHMRPQALWQATDPDGCGRWLAQNPPGPEDPPTTIQLTLPF